MPGSTTSSEDEEIHGFLNDKAFHCERHPVEDLEPREVSAEQEAEEQYYFEMSVRLHKLLEWLAQGPARTGKFMPLGMGVRAAVLLYAVRPDMCDGMKLPQIANKLGVTKEAMNNQMRALKELLGLQFANNRGPAACAKMRAAMAASWARRKAEGKPKPAKTMPKGHGRN
jgi:hypothetical protein